MKFALTAEQEDLKASVRGFLRRRKSLEQFRVHIANEDWESHAATERKEWSALAGEVGVGGLLIDEQYGGSNAQLVEATVVAEQLGSQLSGAPFLTTAVRGALLVAATGSRDAAARYLPGVAEGRTLLAVIDLDHQSVDGFDLSHWHAEGTLSGRVSAVVGAGDADVVLIVASDEAGWSLWAVEAQAHGLTRRPMSAFDPTRPLAELRMDSVAAELIARMDGDPAALRRIRSATTLIAAAEYVGGARACLDSAVKYAGFRTAFGRPIGSFQAIKHRCADIYIELEAAHAALYHAAAAATRNDPEAELFIWATTAQCTQTYLAAAKNTIHVHGATGCTWEHDGHLHLRRAWASQHLFGSPEQVFDRIARRLGLAATEIGDSETVNPPKARTS